MADESVRVRKWHAGWIARHRARCKSTEWPKSSSDAGGTLRAAFVRNLTECDATEEEADAASLAVMRSQPKTAADHPAAVLREVMVCRRAAAAWASTPKTAADAERETSRERQDKEWAITLIFREAWSELQIDRRIEIWEKARTARAINNVRYYRERTAWELAGFPDPATQEIDLATARAEIARLAGAYGEGFDPDPEAWG